MAEMASTLPLMLFLGIHISHTTAAPIEISHPRTPGMNIMQNDQAPIVGFDCNQTEPEILTMSTLEVGKCQGIEKLKPAVNTVYGQLIQKHTLDSIEVRTCQLTKSTSYFKCAGNWHNYNVYPPTIGEVKLVSMKMCDKAHETNTFRWDPHRPVWEDIKINTTYNHAVNQVGWTDRYGYCEGGTYYIAGQEHKDIVVQASFSISLRESWAKVDLDSGTINIENTLQCPYSKGTCSDARTGTHVWTPKPKRCVHGEFKELYRGPVNITTSHGDPTAILTVNSAPFLFTSELGINNIMCGMSLKMTEFPSIHFVPQQNGAYQQNFGTPGQNDIEFITYLNSKITFTYHNLVNSARDMYLASMLRTCEVEREVLKNRIEIIRLNSQSGGLSTLLREGMFARANGEVIHLIKCEPAPVTLRNTDKCYESLPIQYGQYEMFLLPNTHIITPYSTEIPCTPITPLTYKIGGKWWAFTGSFQPATAPTVISPTTLTDLPFTKIKSFSKGGMYAIEQIEAVQKMLVFPTLRESISSDLASGLTNYYGRPVRMDLTSVMSEYDYENIAERNIKKVWGVFSSIGNTVSGLIGFYFVYRLVKGVLTCFIDGKSLYGAFGCSFKLLSMFWSRMSIYFLQQAQTTQTGTQSPTPPPKKDSEEETSFIESQEEDRMTRELEGYKSVFQPPTAPV